METEAQGIWEASAGVTRRELLKQQPLHPNFGQSHRSYRHPWEIPASDSWERLLLEIHNRLLSSRAVPSERQRLLFSSSSIRPSHPQLQTSADLFPLTRQLCLSSPTQVSRDSPKLHRDQTAEHCLSLPFLLVNISCFPSISNGKLLEGKDLMLILYLLIAPTTEPQEKRSAKLITYIFWNIYIKIYKTHLCIKI